MQITISKAEKHISVPDLDFDLMAEQTGLTAEVVKYAWHYGWKQILNDAGSAAKTGAEKFALAEKKWDALRTGNLRVVSEQVRDPVRAEALEMAMAAIAKRPDMKGAKPKAVREKAMGYIEIFMERAAERVAEQAALAELVLDIE